MAKAVNFLSCSDVSSFNVRELSNEVQIEVNETDAVLVTARLNFGQALDLARALLEAVGARDLAWRVPEPDSTGRIACTNAVTAPAKFAADWTQGRSDCARGRR